MRTTAFAVLAVAMVIAVLMVTNVPALTFYAQAGPLSDTARPATPGPTAPNDPSI